MKVALFGNPNSIKQIRSMIEPETLFMEVVDFPCTWGEVVPLLEEVQKNFDAVFFTGVRYFMYASRYLSSNIPWGYPKRSISSVLCTLLKAQLAGVDISKITFDLHDITSRQMRELLCDKVGIPVKEVGVYRYNETAYYQAYLNSGEAPEYYRSTACAYHLDNLKTGRANLCLSSSVGVVEHDVLKDKPAFLVPVTEDDVNETLNDLRIRYERQELQKQGGFVPAVLSLSVQMEDAYNGSVQEFRQMYTTHQIEAGIASYSKSIGAAVEKQSNTSFFLYTTQEELYLITDHFTKFDLAQRLQYLPDVTGVSIGIGFGCTYSTAKDHAQISRRIASRQNASCYYIMDEKEQQSGPFVLRRHMQKKEMAEIQLERIANETGISTKTLNMLMKAQAQYGLETATSEQLAKICNCTQSSMNRIVSKLVAMHYAEIIGVQPQNGAGRPKRLIRLKLPTL